MPLRVDPRVFNEGEYGAIEETVVIRDFSDREAVLIAIRAATTRWWLVDGAGREHVPGSAEHDEWRDKQVESELDEDYWGIKYVSDVRDLPDGSLEVYVDSQDLMPRPMGEALRRVLTEELERAGVDAAFVTVPEEE